ncbi:MAG: hypothetical protein FJ395_16215 [Verrucomicrobia bacterium]|nr:hypothetical protein [Verrucomicrobiota bacterium]
MKHESRHPRVVAAIRAADAWCHVITLPATDMAELEQMVRLQIDDLSPLPPEETVFGFLPLGPNGTGTRVLIALAPKTVSDERVAALNAEIVSVDAIAVFHALLRRNLLPHDAQLHLFLQLEPDGATLIAHSRGQPLLVRSLLTADPDALLAEIAHTRLALAIEQPDAAFGGIVLAGPGAGELARKTDNARALDAKDIPDLADALREDAAMDNARYFNLLSDEWRERRRRAQSRRRLVRGLVALAGLYALALLAYAAASVTQSWRLNELAQEMKAIQTPFSEARTARNALQMLESRLDTEQTALESLREITLLLPDNVRLVGFTFKKGQSVTLRGETASAALASEFIGRLERCPVFAGAKTVSMPTTPEGLTKFEVVCTLKPIGTIAGAKP